MSEYAGKVAMRELGHLPVDIEINLDEDFVTMTSAGEQIGTWHLGDLQVRGLDLGFDVAINGVWGHLETDDDGGFAMEVGLHSAPPRLRRLMLAKLAHRPEQN